MSLFSMGPSYSPRWLVKHYPCGDLGTGTVVDVGGSKGEYAIAILQQYPNLRVIVQDLPDVVEKPRSSTPTELTDIVSFMAHDFFTDQPIRDAGVYLKRWVLHDWSDTHAIRILRALIPALKKGARIGLHECIVSEPGETLTLWDRQVLENCRNRFMVYDIAMHALTNGKEREANDWKALFAGADTRFRVLSIEIPPMSSLGIIVVNWDG
ncbi:cercosporin toxin biosynthesis protein-like protein [Bimuria novae-zelandiae CBS 107.79]|uniref:Cercosporin toxin biosynthesis protein-like protein n=1 Tax=Bimuria novae-zelandiae CBS 107.79 TaxID=1447943 RepID=A0A6A5VLM8_9PLEO|nr:cercosporin toxin biosynthesis protein-like protein [Bimuria novae-zelandiae CBS 107.79]